MAHSSKYKDTLQKAFNIKSRLNSIRYAIHGIWLLIQGEPNAIIHSLATIVVIISACIKHLSKTEWCLLMIAIGIIWIVESINTAIEKLCNLYSESFHPMVKQIKDIAAASVLLAALTSLSIGILIFLF